MIQSRKLPIGAEVQKDGGVHFRLWAPDHKKVEVVLEAEEGASKQGRAYEMKPEGNGYFSLLVEMAKENTRYRFRLGESKNLHPDPASRFQPEGPHGPSQVIDPEKFQWNDSNWKGVEAKGQVIYEMHIGTFTREGTYLSAIKEFKHLSETGITVLEVMPLAEFPGSFGWGYDGVDLYAPMHIYGKPDELRIFIDQAHREGLGVILDVVYNHLGPDGNYLKEFTPYYFTDKYKNEWGEAINFDGENSLPVREFFTSNARYWIEEFHFDGLRLDATQQVFDSSGTHVLAEITKAIRKAGKNRKTFIVAENEPQLAKLVKPTEENGYGMNCLWNDDLHHSAMVALTGHNEAYYKDYYGRPQEFISAFKWGYLYQGQYYSWQKNNRGTQSFSLKPENFCTFIQNHDQIANSGRGQRVHELTSPGKYKAMTALMLLAPGTPMLFQGQEFASSSPFYYFADHSEELAKKVFQGRSEFLSQFPSLATPEMQSCLPDPASQRTFERSKIDFSERKSHAPIYKMHRDLLTLRREDPVLSRQDRDNMHGAVLSEEAFLLRFFDKGGNDRLLIVNMGRDLELNIAPEPLLAPPEGRDWKMIWASEDPEYGGCGSPEVLVRKQWKIQGYAAELLASVKTEHKTEK
ncbi:MAG: malto-oligosyltrehalose trehalohydrolase [Ignavibacteria bacterium]|nr:malto-oligosyltrehalose trehalohydrolase [Ignavibacteria bacterium]MCU7503447.1 malto-oligosyltrehalose trehalohydrolase [Ignavibacteria bacterium]MCU7516221.1 malto-oligosyltrehalose trehalohydrolase [Ignavibacteria bacterium]